MNVLAYPHRCNAWCRDGVHASVMWSAVPDERAIEALNRHIESIGGQLLSVRPALEAPATSPGGRQYDNRYVYEWVPPGQAIGDRVGAELEAGR